MNSRILDCVCAALILLDIAVVSILIFAFFSPGVDGPGLTELYSSRAITLICLKGSLQYVPAVLLIVGFLRHSSFVRWLLPAYVFIVVVVHRFWVILPDLPEYHRLLDEARQLMENPDNVFDGPVTVVSYPYTAIYIGYAITLLYVFVFRPGLLKKSAIGDRTV